MNLKSSDPLVGQLVTTGVTGDSLTVYIPPGEARSASTVATGGVAFDGVGTGMVTVQATIPGFTTTVAGVQVDPSNIGDRGIYTFATPTATQPPRSYALGMRVSF